MSRKKASPRATGKVEVAGALLNRIRDIWQAARSQAARSVNSALVQANWLIGQQIVEAEQGGATRAGYGTALLKELSEKLIGEFGSGFSVSALQYVRAFYLAYPDLLARIHHAPRGESADEAKSGHSRNQHAVRVESAISDDGWIPGYLHSGLSWTHYRALLKVERREARDFYEIEALRNGWSGRQLERQINTLLFERLLKSRDKAGVMALANQGLVVSRPKVNIFNISKINSEVRGGKSPRIKRLSEYIGESYFDYLAGLPDLVLLMDESHRYRASAGARAINELKPILGLEFTATPFVETNRGAVAFKNVIYDYPLARAMADGFVKEPAVVTRKNFDPKGMTPEAIERLKLEDGVRLHESVKVELETYARETDSAIVKPFLLVIARDTTHAGSLLALIQSDAFFEGRYKDKVIQVDSSKTGAEEEAMITRLLKVEHTEEPTEIVIHVNMLKEGWDVTNLYTIVPLRAANARTLIEQSIGRGLRLPYGRRTGVTAVDRLNIVAHDKFQEIIDEASKPDSAIRLQAVVLDTEQMGQKTTTVVSQSHLANKLGLEPALATGSTTIAGENGAPAFSKPEEARLARLTFDVIRKLESQPQTLPTAEHLKKPEIQAAIVKAVEEQHAPTQMELEGVIDKPDIAAIVAKTVDLITQQTIDIPRILVVPKGEVKSGFKPFTLDLSTLNYPAVADELWVQHLRTNQFEIVALGRGGVDEARLEDYVVSGLVDFDDISYDDHAELLYDLASQTVEHLRSYLSEEDARKVLRCYQRPISQFIHAQMQAHYFEDAAGYEVRVSKGFTELKPSAYTHAVEEQPADYRVSPDDKNNMAKFLFGGFEKCLYPVQKFASDAERKLAVILERDSVKWFKPAKGQFQIFYRHGSDHLEYQPDFVAETDNAIYMLEPKMRKELDDPVVLAKKEVAVSWCTNASRHTASCGGKPWRYALIPHDAIAENMTLTGVVDLFGEN